MSNIEPPYHNWKLAWPGNWCLRCGIEDPMEYAEWVDCTWCGGTGFATSTEQNPPECTNCCGQGAYPDPNTPCPPCYYPALRVTVTSK